jgi:hypothetical protein
MNVWRCQKRNLIIECLVVFSDDPISPVSRWRREKLICGRSPLVQRSSPRVMLLAVGVSSTNKERWYSRSNCDRTTLATASGLALAPPQRSRASEQPTLSQRSRPFPALNSRHQPNQIWQSKDRNENKKEQLCDRDLAVQSCSLTSDGRLFGIPAKSGDNGIAERGQDE